MKSIKHGHKCNNNLFHIESTVCQRTDWSPRMNSGDVNKIYSGNDIILENGPIVCT